MTPVVISTTSADVSLGADGILRTQVLRSGRQTLDSARENLAAWNTLSPDHRRPMVVDLRDMNTAIDRDARLFYASSELAPRVTAVALLVGSAASRLVGNFFVAVSRPAMPLKVFTNEAQALAWLADYCE
jgi:hypothetical protein